ncbi:MAG: ABC transporter substrate-binding protein [Acetobacteraceae bacterium]
MRLLLGLVTALALAMPAAAQTLTLLRNIDAPHYDPARTSAGATTEISFLVGDTLVGLDYDLKTITPLLADSWTVSPDGKLYTFKLREDVTFCSGKKMTAADVVYSFNRVLAPETRAPFKWRMGPVKEVRAPSPYVVEYELTAPYGELLLQLTNFQATIVNQENVEALGKDFGIKGIDGTGPFCFQSWEPRSQIVATRHDAYKWGPPIYQNRGPAKYEKIVWKIVPEEAARLAAMASGQVDMTYSMADQYLPQLAKMPNMQVLRPEANLRLFYLGFKITRENIADVRVRRALSMAVDRKQIVDSIYFGNGEPATSFLHPKTPDFDPKAVPDWLKFDPQAAGALLDEAGWKMESDGFRYQDGKRLTLQLYGFAGGRSPKVAEAVQGFWRKIGVDLKLQMWDGTIVFSKLAQQDYDIWSIAFPYSSAGDALRLYFHSANIPSPNRMNWKDPETDRLLEEGNTALDPAARAAALSQVQKKVQDQALWVPLVHEGLALVVNKRVKNVRAHHVYTSMVYKLLDATP